MYQNTIILTHYWINHSKLVLKFILWIYSDIGNFVLFAFKLLIGFFNYYHSIKSLLHQHMFIAGLR